MTVQEGQYFLDIFNNDGFLGDLPLVNFAYAPYFDVLPRKYRFRLLNASMSRFYKLALSYNGAPVPFKFIANDGNLVVNPITLTQLDEQGIAERYDIVVDFSAFPVGSRIYLVNLLRMRDDGRGPREALSLSAALAGLPEDPVVGRIMEFRVVAATPSVDQPGAMLTIANSCGPNDRSLVPAVLTQQIPIVAPVRTRVIEYGRSGDEINGTSRDPVTGQCTPDCPEFATFPWSIKINGEDANTFNANRISLLVPAPGEIEHWTLVNGGGGWDHPIHLHFEEGITMSRADMSTGVAVPSSIPATEYLVRKDVLAPASVGGRHVPGAVRRVRRVLREPLPQYGARGLRHAAATAAPVGRWAAGGGDADAHPDAGRRVLQHTRDPAGGRPEVQLVTTR